jgi:FAD dependent monooxygenase
MTVEYACVFGISSGLVSLEAGAQINALLDKAAIMAVHGKDGCVFWFLFKKLDRKHVYPAVPRFSPEDAAELCNKMQDVHMYKGLCFGDIWKNSEVVSMTALEEGLFKTWFYDRMVLVGDSAHKVSVACTFGKKFTATDTALLDDPKLRSRSKHCYRRRCRSCFAASASSLQDWLWETFASANPRYAQGISTCTIPAGTTCL